MKKIFVTILSLVLVLSLVACKRSGNQEQPKTPTEPTISGVESKTIRWGSVFDPLEGVSATDTIDGDITSSVKVTGTIDTFRSIQQELEYSVTNSNGLTAKSKRLITVDFASEEDMAKLIKDNDPKHILKYEYSKQNFYNVDFSVDGSNLEGGVPGWQSWGAGGSYSVHDGIMQVNVGTDYFQISNNENILKAGQYYIVEFKAKADIKQEDKALEFTFRAIWGTEANGGWDDHKIQYWQDKPINTDWQTYYFLFKAKTDEENCLCLITQGIRNTVYYKDIYIYEVNPTSDPLNIPEEVNTNYDLSSDNAEYWDKYSLDDNGTFTIAENLLTINVKDVYMQVANHRNKLDVNKSYKLEFDIETSVDVRGGGTNDDDFQYRIIVGSEETGWTPDNTIYPEENLEAGVKKHIVCYFTPKYATKNVFCYIFQGFTGEVKISNISVELGKKPSDELEIGTDWRFWSGDTADTLFAVEDQVVTYNTTTAIPYYQISNNENTLKANTKYSISFDLTPKAALAAGQFKFIFGSENGPWAVSVDEVLNEAVEANATKHLTYEFTTPAAEHNVFCFIFMNYQGEATLANFVIEESGEAQPPLPEPEISEFGTDWRFWSGDTAEKLFTVENQVVTYNTTTAIPYYQISNNENELVKDKTYTIKFDLVPGAALAAGQFKFIFGSENGPWTVLVDQVLNEAVEANATKSLTYEFTAPADEHNVYCFIFMGYEGNAVIKNVEVSEKGASQPVEEPVDPDNIITYGTFTTLELGNLGAPNAQGYGSGDWDSYAEVVADPLNANNKVLKLAYTVEGKGFASFFKFATVKPSTTYVIELDYLVQGTTDNFGIRFAPMSNPDILKVFYSGAATEGWQHATFELTTLDATYDSIGLWFNTGSSADNAGYVDNIVIKEKPAAEVELELVDPSKYILGNGYYNSTDTSRYNLFIDNDTTAKKFVGTVVFTKETLPVGSVIEIGEGYQYRPEGWINNEKQSSRNNNTTEARVEVTEEWWGNYIKRAFNISKVAGGALDSEEEYNAAVAAFKIYVPTGTVIIAPEITEFGTDWRFWSGDTAEKLFTVENQVVTYTANTAIPYYQISNNENELVAGKTYTIKFDLVPGAALAAGQFKFMFGSEATGWNVLVEEVLNEAVAADATKSLEYDFTVPAGQHNVYCFIFMGYQGSAVIKNIEVAEKVATPDPKPSTISLGTNWGFWSGDTAEKLFEVAEQVVTYNTATPIPYYQISNNGNTLENGKNYRIFFELTPAAELAAGQFKFIYGDENGGWHPSVDLVYNSAIAANATKVLSFDFACTSDSANAFCFIFMNYQGSAVLKNFSIIEKPDAKAITPTAVNQSSDYATWNDAKTVATLSNLKNSITGGQWARWDFAGSQDLGYKEVKVVLNVTPGLKVMAKLDALTTPANNAYDGIAGNKQTLVAGEDGVLTFVWNLADFEAASKAASKEYALENIQKIVFFACDGTGNAEVMASATVELVSISLE